MGAEEKGEALDSPLLQHLGRRLDDAKQLHRLGRHHSCHVGSQRALRVISMLVGFRGAPLALSAGTFAGSAGRRASCRSRARMEISAMAWAWRLTAVPAVFMVEALLIGVDAAADFDPDGTERTRIALVARPAVARMSAPGVPVVFRHGGVDRTAARADLGAAPLRLGVVASEPGGLVGQYIPVGGGMFIHGTAMAHAGFVAVAVNTAPTLPHEANVSDHLLFDDAGNAVTVVPYAALRGRVLAMLT